MIACTVAFDSKSLPLSVRRRLAAQIRTWRADHSQQEVADVCGVSRAQVGNWENELSQAPEITQVWLLEAFKPGFAKACGVRVVPVGAPRRTERAGRPAKR